MSRPVRFLHVIPGRFRAVVAGLKGDVARARELEVALYRSPLVRRVAASAVTGTLLVHYDPPDSASVGDLVARLLGSTDREEIEQLAAFAGEELERAARAACPELVDWGERVVHGFEGWNARVAHSLGGADLRVLFPAALLALAGYRVATSRLVMPRWYEFLWFCFTSFTTLNGRRGTSA